jgi:CHAT domain-containing protein
MVYESWVYGKLDRVDLARPIAEEALALAQRVGDPVVVQNAASALANICADMMDNPCSLQNAELGLKAIRSSSRARPIDIASQLLDVVESHWRTDDKAGSLTRFEEARAIVDSEDKKHHVIGQQWASVETDVGAFYLQIMKCAAALPYLEKAADLDTQVYGPDSTALNTTLSNLAYAQVCAGRTDESLKTYERTRQIFLRMYGPNHSQMAYVETGYSLALEFKGRYQDAADMALDAHRTQRERLSLAIRLLPERQALALADDGNGSFNTLVSLVALHPQIRIPDVYQEVVRSRALVAEEMAQREAALSRKPDPAVEVLQKEMDAERKAVMDMQGSSNSAAHALIDATAKMERTERELAARSAPFRIGERARSSNLDDLRKNLPKQSVLISYVRYTQYRMHKDEFRAFRIPSYLAFVLHPDENTVSLHDLGDAKPIDDLIEKMRASADAEAQGGGVGSRRNEREYRQAGEQLRKLIWDPFAGDLEKAQLALIVPDGLLNLIPFSALPVGNGYLVERGPVVHVLTSERDLLPGETGEKKTGLLAVGSPAFELARANAAPDKLRDAPIDCEAFAKMEFNALPASFNEVKDISSTWKRWNGKEPERLLTGQDATRSRFLDAASHSRALHIATHAFVLDKSCGNGNPLLHSGLVFAGVNTSRNTSILTAQQIASLDLRGVDWAVLSACNTGNGELKDGEGVLGLERAFRVAGAKSVVMALWPVEDEVTREFMRKLYAERFGRHATTANAVWNAERELLKERRASGKETHPWYWAGFVGAGTWQ